MLKQIALMALIVVNKRDLIHPYALKAALGSRVTSIVIVGHQESAVPPVENVQTLVKVQYPHG